LGGSECADHDGVAVLLFESFNHDSIPERQTISFANLNLDAGLIPDSAGLCHLILQSSASLAEIRQGRDARACAA